MIEILRHPIVLAMAFLAMTVAGSAAPNRLRVSTNGRFLQYDDGKPFFYLADTAWELFHRLNREEATRYLEDRARKGFTAIQAVALAELDGLTTPNAYGALPLVDKNPTRPNDAYFTHVDFIVDKAEAYRQTEAYLKAIRKRSVWVEPLFGEAKEFHGLRRFRLRRLRKVNIEGVMVAAGQNLKRLIQHHLESFFLFSNSLLSV